MGRVSRDARLLFIQIWTICDDSGITRAASRMLASLLFPYDDDAPSLLDGWVDELEREGCIVRYQVDGASYIKVQKWADHQRIDKPSASKFPQFVEGSRVFPESSRKVVQDQGPRTKDQGRDQGGDAREKVRETPNPEPLPPKATLKTSKGTRWPPDAVVPEDWIDSGARCRANQGFPEIDLRAEAFKFANYWASKAGGGATKLDWKKTWLNWCISVKGISNGSGFNGKKSQLEQLADIVAEDRAASVFDH